MNRLDATLEEIYRRLGGRMIAACQAFNLIAASVLIAVIIVTFRRQVEMPWADAILLLGIWAVLAIVGATVAIAGLLRSTSVLTHWLEGERHASQAADAWLTALRLPAIATRWNVIVAAGVMVPGLTVAGSIIAKLDADDILWISLSGVWAPALAGAGAFFTNQLAVRPILRDIAASLPDQTPHYQVTSVRRKLLVLVPIGLGVSAAAGVAISIPPGADLGGVIPELLVAIGATMALAAPIALLLAYTTLQPLDDLLAATERMKRGDFTSRVPELSADEYGVLAGSFNEAMRGLAERERLARDNVELLGEVTASRARIVAASDAERRRVERNIHDGAQQQLVALAVKLRMLEESVGDDERLRTAIAEIEDRLKGALQELRELARGLHPSVLTTDGLPPALDQLASRSPLPVIVEAPEERYPEAVESTAYFVACEALANVAKYARATQARISVRRRDGRLLVEVIDDGIGGAHADAGSGLTGLVDRVAALDGTLTVHSPDGHGTKVIADLPLA